MAQKKRKVFEKGHKRKFLVVVDETPECEIALEFAASSAEHAQGGALVLLYMIVPGEFQHWLGVEEVAREEGTNKARAVFRLFGRKLKALGHTKLKPEEIIREGSIAEEIISLIEEDEDIAILVLGASKDPSGPGPLVSMLAAGTVAGSFPIPITIVPGELSTDDIKGLA